MTVLLVEDELFIRMDLEQRIRKLGIDIVGTSATGQAAVQLAKEHKPDVILMDIKLKGDMDGIEAANEITTYLPCNIVFISAFEKQDLEGILTNSKCNIGYYPKPITDANLQKIFAEFGS